MTDEEPKPQGETAASFPWIEPEEGVFEEYSNYVHMNWTLFDVRIRFGQVVPNPEHPPERAGFAVSERAAITMPWGQAKALRDMLVDVVNKYESVNGEITVPILPT